MYSDAAYRVKTCAAGGGAGTHPGRHLGDSVFRRSDHDRIHVFFGYESFGLHLAMTAIVAATLALVIVMIIALDWPFRGQISVSADPFIMTQQSWADAPLQMK